MEIGLHRMLSKQKTKTKTNNYPVFCDAGNVGCLRSLNEYTITTSIGFLFRWAINIFMEDVILDGIETA